MPFLPSLCHHSSKMGVNGILFVLLKTLKNEIYEIIILQHPVALQNLVLTDFIGTTDIGSNQNCEHQGKVPIKIDNISARTTCC